MAGAFTHLIICDVAKKKNEIAEQELKKLLNRHTEFLFLGAVSPDLPYLSFKTGTTNWADLMHYKRTNGIALAGHGALRSGWSGAEESTKAKLAWLMGYVAHVLADVTIHPIVQATVGTYEEHKEEHRICEMTQDSLVYRERKNAEVRYGEFSSALRFCRHSPHFGGVMDFWAEQAEQVYSVQTQETPNPQLWFSTYTTALDAAEGGSGVVAVFRHIGIGREFIYKTSKEIMESNPERYQKYYANVRLPGGAVGNFVPMGFTVAVDRIVNTWNTMYASLGDGRDVAGLIRDWNLDTGELNA
jgi:hypothetical protein